MAATMYGMKINCYSGTT